jgi:hypothetical protein
MSTTTRLTELTASEWRRQSGSKLPLPNERFAFLIRRRGQNGRIERVRTELKEGMRRPCCWPGCPHR